MSSRPRWILGPSSCTTIANPFTRVLVVVTRHIPLLAHFLGAAASIFETELFQYSLDYLANFNIFHFVKIPVGADRKLSHWGSEFNQGVSA